MEPKYKDRNEMEDPILRTQINYDDEVPKEESTRYLLTNAVVLMLDMKFSIVEIIETVCQTIREYQSRNNDIKGF